MTQTASTQAPPASYLPTMPHVVPAPQPRTTVAFQAQAAIAFGLSSAFVGVGILYLPVDAWQRGFLVLGMLFVVSSCFTLAKVVRDAQETKAWVSRIDEARREKLMADHDPYRAV